MVFTASTAPSSSERASGWRNPRQCARALAGDYTPARAPVRV
jgi:hypothetical protein